MTDDDWEKIARSRLEEAGYTLILKVVKPNLLDLSDNPDADSWVVSSTTENENLFIGINTKTMTEAEFILKYV